MLRYYNFKKIISSEDLIFIPVVLGLIQLCTISLKFDSDYIIITLLSIVFKFFVFCKVNIKKNICLLTILLYYELTLVSSPLIDRMLFDENYDIDQSIFLLKYELFLVILSIIFYWENNNYNHDQLKFKKNNLILFKVFIVMIAISFSFIAFKYSIGIMGQVAPTLPFKFEPLVNLTRSHVIPLFFLTLFFVSYKKYVLLFYSNTWLFVVWLIIETFLRHSRGIFLYSLIPIIFFLIKKDVSKSGLIKIILFSMLLTFTSFIIFKSVTELRGSHFDIKSSYKEAYKRFVHENIIIGKIFDEKQKYGLGTLDNYINNKGGVNIHTFLLDKTKPGVPHSSGITALTDGLLINLEYGGYITMFLLVIMVRIFDYICNIDKILDVIHPLFAIYILERIHWGDGFWSFFMFRSIFTILVFPLTIFFIYLLLKYSLISDSKIK